MTISFKVSDKTFKKLTDFYEDLKYDKTPNYATFQAKDGDTVVTLYDSKTVVFQGKDADLASDFWIETERQENKKLIVNNSDNKKKKKIYIDPKILNSTTIGSDEVGTGDYFGPIVVTATFVDKENINYLKELGVTDSKLMDDDKIMKIVPKIIKKIPYTSFILNNSDYNEKIKTMNLNKIKAILHNKVLSDLTSKYKADYIVVDEFVSKENYYNYLKEAKNICNNITFLTKGEVKCLAVACASIISRYIFIREFARIEQDLGIEILKGASSSVDEKGVVVVKKYGFDKLYEVAKINFKNTEKIKKLIEK